MIIADISEPGLVEKYLHLLSELFGGGSFSLGKARLIVHLYTFIGEGSP